MKDRFVLHIAVLVSFFACCFSQKAAAQFEGPLPFPSPIYSSTDTVRLTIIGDVMMHKRQLEYDYHSFLRHLSEPLRSADFAVANMEFTLGGAPYTGYPSFSAPDGYAEYLASDCGVDVLLTANNHILDKGNEGLKRTLDVCSSLESKYGVRVAGSGRDEKEWEEASPLMLFKKGISIALVNFTYGTNRASSTPYPKVGMMNREEVSSCIARAKELGADFIIALPHWGTEYSLRHSESQQKWAEWLISEGVDAIVGAHPHVVQDSVHIGGKPVFYSIGNAVSNMSARNTRLSLMVTLSFVRDAANGKTKMLPPSAEYLWCTLPNMLEKGYASIIIKEWATRKSEWLTPYDYENMLSTLRRVSSQTGVSSESITPTL